ncbi:MAG: LPS export ABC transporter permease LptG [marine bacterium B5-7]|nr:MAG: LPS export ABC transporter permease LptG [marine bacterium B5-7]
MIIDLYFGRTIGYYTLVALGVLLGLFTFVNFIDQLGDLGVGNYNILEVLKFVVMSIPYTVYELFPMGALLGTILALSSLAVDSELVVLRASGFSLVQITSSVLKAGIVMVALAFVVGEVISPTTETIAKNGRASALQKDVRQQTEYGLWMRDTTTYVNIGEILPDLTLLRVRVFEFDKNARLRSLVYATSGRFVDQNWRLTDVRQTVITDDGLATTRKLNEANWETSVSPQIMSVFLIKPEQMSVWQLKRYIQHLRRNDQETSRYELVFWTKVVLPLSIGVMVALAIPFVFGNLRAGNTGRNLFVGIMIGLGFYAANKSLGYVVLAYGLSPLAGALLPLFLFLTLAMIMYRRVI